MSSKSLNIRLSANEKKILSAMDFHAMRPMRELRKLTGLREHTIRYCVKGLEEKGMLSVMPLLNVNCLGLSHYYFFFSLSTVKRSTHAALIDYLVKSEYVSFLCELGGDYQYELTVCARSLSEVENFLSEMARKFGSIFIGKSAGSRMRLIHYRYKYLLESKGSPKTLCWGICDKQEQIDELDHKILSLMSNDKVMSSTGISRLLKIPYSTAEYRLRRLEEHGIIAGYILFVDAEKLGYQYFLVTIYSKGFNVALARKLEDYCLKNPYVRFLLENLGEWDFELGIDTNNPQDVVKIMQELSELFGAEIHTMKSLPVFRYIKVANYPFREFRV